MKQFTYQRRILHPNTETLEETLNTLGADGWELVAVVPSQGASPCPVWVFKRELSHEEYGRPSFGF